MDASTYDPAHPILFLNICGEGPCGGAPSLDGEVGAWAKQLGGAALASLEHRMYGKSLPTGGLVTSNLLFLTIDNVLADLNNFIQHFPGFPSPPQAAVQVFMVRCSCGMVCTPVACSDVTTLFVLLLCGVACVVCLV